MTRSSSRCSKGRRRRSMTFWQCPGQKVCHEGFLGSNSLAVKGLRDRRGTLRLLSSSFLGVPYRILNMNHKKELLRSLWVRFRFGGSAREARGGRRGQVDKDGHRGPGFNNTSPESEKP